MAQNAQQLTRRYIFYDIFTSYLHIIKLLNIGKPLFQLRIKANVYYIEEMNILII